MKLIDLIDKLKFDKVRRYSFSFFDIHKWYENYLYFAKCSGLITDPAEKYPDQYE